MTAVILTAAATWACDASDRPRESGRLLFDFGAAMVQPGYSQVLPDMIYSRESGYGFEPGSSVIAVNRGGNDALRSDFCTSDQPFYFSVALPEGNYNVTVTLGDLEGPSKTTVKAELRRLMLEKVFTDPGKFAERTFTVNVRTPRIDQGGEVRLKDRERNVEMWSWDEKLTLEFNNTRPSLCALTIEPAKDAPTVYLLGDSTVCDQPSEPWNSWGQMLPRFFRPGVAVANHAESGESIASSLDARRVDKVLSIVRPNDYVFAQFGHNDMKSSEPTALGLYKVDLRKLVLDVRERGATPVLITSMERQTGVQRDTLGEYPASVRELAREENVALIDLHAMSKELYRALGPNLSRAFQDGTHHNSYGSYQLARCVIEGIRQNRLDLASSIADDVRAYDPAYPGSVESFQIPPSPKRSESKPEGD